MIVQRFRERARGFTLVEVLVALVIVAFGMGAVLTALTSAADSETRLREKTFAEWVGLNQLATERLRSTQPATGTREGDATMAGMPWHWQETVENMDIPGIRRITIRVRQGQSGTAASQAPKPAADKTDWMATVMGFRGDAINTPQTQLSIWDGANATPPGTGRMKAHAMGTLRPYGFTLIELLVALFITALLFAMGYGSLTEALNSRKEVEEQGARLSAVQQTIRVLEQDIELMQPRPARDPLGNGYEPPLVASQNASSSNASDSSDDSGRQGPALLTFTRGSWANPAGLPRSELERVSYLVRDSKLIRQNLPVMDTTAASTIVERELLDQVVSVSFRYMDESMTWATLWPTPNMQVTSPQMLLRARPVAVEVTLTLKDLGVLTRIIEVAG